MLVADRRLVGLQAVVVLVYKPVVDTAVDTVGCRMQSKLAARAELASRSSLGRLMFPLCQGS